MGTSSKDRTNFGRWNKCPGQMGNIAQKINRVDLYTEAAEALEITVPNQLMRSSKLMDGVVWDGNDPVGYTNSFKF